MLNRQLCLGLWWSPSRLHRGKQALDCWTRSFTQTANWMVQGSKERGANQSDDLALQLHLQLGIVTAGVGEIPSGRMRCKWGNRRDTGLSWPG